MVSAKMFNIGEPPLCGKKLKLRNFLKLKTNVTFCHAALINNLQQIGLRSRYDLFLLFQFTVKYCKTHRIKLPRGGGGVLPYMG